MSVGQHGNAMKIPKFDISALAILGFSFILLITKSGSLKGKFQMTDVS